MVRKMPQIDTTVSKIKSSVHYPQILQAILKVFGGPSLPRGNCIKEDIMSFNKRNLVDAQ